MATVTDVSAPYANHLRTVLATQDGVCAVCHSIVLPSYERCYQCNQAADRLTATADAVAFVALAVKGEQLARELWTYKNGATEAVRREPRTGLSAVLWRWLSLHEGCVAAAAGVDEFAIVTTVPSTSSRIGHPLVAIVSGIVQATSGRYRDLLTLGRVDGNLRDARDDRYIARRNVPTDEPILVIDDTWTTGGHAQSAASALRLGGSGPVGVVTIGRHFTRDPGEGYNKRAEEYLRRSRSLGWDWDRCCICDSR